MIRVNERDFAISLSPRRVSAGSVLLRVDNKGPDRHEFIVVRVPKGGLPLRGDGMTLSEEKLEPVDRRRARARRARRRSATCALQLRPGRYEVFCNMAGHFMGGMHAQLVVT